jgi:hypothetical protein
MLSKNAVRSWFFYPGGGFGLFLAGRRSLIGKHHDQPGKPLTVDRVPQNLQESFRIARYLHFPHDPACVIHNTTLVRPKWSMLRSSF